MRLEEKELTRWGRLIGQTLEAPAVLCLQGPLGAGKSVLARAIGRGAGVEGPMPSPSYNLLLQYESTTGKEIVHLDLYRIDDPDEIWELGWAQLGEGRQIVLIEWPERAGDLLPENRWTIRLAVPEDDPLSREVAVERIGHPPELAAFPLSVSAQGE